MKECILPKRKIYILPFPNAKQTEYPSVGVSIYVRVKCMRNHGAKSKKIFSLCYYLFILIILLLNRNMFSIPLLILMYNSSCLEPD